MKTLENRNRSSESMMNVFEEVNIRKKTCESVFTIESLNLNNINDNNNNLIVDESNDPMLKLTKEEYLESVFGPSMSTASERVRWRGKIKHIVTSNYMHIAIIVLVLLDSLCVTIELVIDLEDKDDLEALKITKACFKYMGLLILSIFVVEMTLKLLFIWREVIKSKLEIIDMLIVYVSFVLEIIFMNNQALSALG